MLVFTSVMVTVTPGSASPDGSVMLPTRPPLTACASAPGATHRTRAAIDRHVASARLTRRTISLLLTTALAERGGGGSAARLQRCPGVSSGYSAVKIIGDTI